MPTGNVSSKANPSYTPARATALRFSRGNIIMSLEDGREIFIPLHLYPTLQNARPAQRATFTFLGDGRALHWPSLDLDLSADGLLHGLPEKIPAPLAPPSRRNRTRA